MNLIYQFLVTTIISWYHTCAFILSSGPHQTLHHPPPDTPSFFVQSMRKKGLQRHTAAPEMSCQRWCCGDCGEDAWIKKTRSKLSPDFVHWILNYADLGNTNFDNMGMVEECFKNVWHKTQKNNRETPWNATTSLFWWLFDAGLKALIPCAAQQLQVVPNVHGLGGKHRGCAVQGARLMNTTSAPIPWHVSYIHSLHNIKWLIQVICGASAEVLDFVWSIWVSISVESSWFCWIYCWRSGSHHVSCSWHKSMSTWRLNISDVGHSRNVLNTKSILRKRLFFPPCFKSGWSMMISGEPLISLIPIYQRSTRWSSDKENNLICFSKRQHTKWCRDYHSHLG